LEDSVSDGVISTQLKGDNGLDGRNLVFEAMIELFDCEIAKLFLIFERLCKAEQETEKKSDGDSKHSQQVRSG
jgi:hypothetical protein